VGLQRSPPQTIAERVSVWHGSGMPSKATTVAAYLKDLPTERRTALEAVRTVILKNLPTGYVEGMQYGMIGYFVPHDLYPPGYHCNPKEPLPFAQIASQKNHMAVYLMCLYTDPEHGGRFQQAWAKTGKKLDMGKSCIRFRKVEDLALDVIGQTIRNVPMKQFIRFYEAALQNRPKRKSSPPKRAAKKKTTRPE
jgi:hypothetical protein